MSAACGCEVNHTPKLLVLTGGPCAGKTAAIEVIKRRACPHVMVLPEVADMLWDGGFPRLDTTSARRAAQRAIVHVQIELQRLAIEAPTTGLIVCDRGTLDGVAYWPGDLREYFDELGTTEDRELARYATVIHMQSATEGHGYAHTRDRIETAAQAQEIDKRIFAAYARHPRHFVVESDADFLAKLQRTLDLVQAEIPACCR